MEHVFISYVREDTQIVDRLVKDLESKGVNVWLDRSDINVGVHWSDAIRNAIRHGSFFLACFSKQYQNKDKTYMNEELTLAVEELRLRPTDRAWFIPVRLDECDVPDRSIGGGKTVRDIQYADLSVGWDAGITRILKTVSNRGEIRKSKNELPQFFADFYARGRSPYPHCLREKGKRLVEYVIGLPDLAVEENQRWLLWELFHNLISDFKYQCEIRLGLEEYPPVSHQLFTFVIWDPWSETRHRGVLTMDEARKGLWEGGFDDLIDTRVSSEAMELAKQRFSWHRDYAPATQVNPFLGEDLRYVFESITGKARGLEEGELGSFLYDLQHILMSSFGRGLKFVFGLGRNDMCNQYSGLVRPDHDEDGEMLVLEIYDTFFRSLKYTCVCSKHWSYRNEAGVDMMTNEAETWLGLA